MGQPVGHLDPKRQLDRDRGHPAAPPRRLLHDAVVAGKPSARCRLLQDIHLRALGHDYFQAPAPLASFCPHQTLLRLVRDVGEELRKEAVDAKLRQVFSLSLSPELRGLDRLILFLFFCYYKFFQYFFVFFSVYLTE